MKLLSESDLGPISPEYYIKILATVLKTVFQIGLTCFNTSFIDHNSLAFLGEYHTIVKSLKEIKTYHHTYLAHLYTSIMLYSFGGFLRKAKSSGTLNNYYLIKIKLEGRKNWKGQNRSFNPSGSLYAPDTIWAADWTDVINLVWQRLAISSPCFHIPVYK